MTPHQEEGPRAGQQRGHTQDRSQGIVRRTHPYCKWYETAIVDALPGSCPLHRANPLEVLTEYRDIAWKEVGRSGKCFERGDAGGAFVLLRQVDCCNRCLADGMAANPTVRRLRKGTLGGVPE